MKNKIENIIRNSRDDDRVSKILQTVYKEIMKNAPKYLKQHGDVRIGSYNLGIKSFASALKQIMEVEG